MPIVLPPAVVGIALLHTFGREGLLGDLLTSGNIQIPFSTTAVIIAQVVVSAPFYIQSSASAFRRVNHDLLLVAQTLGYPPSGVFQKVALPIALPGLVSGAALSWARALGAFGATLFFAGNLTSETQTMPLAIYSALESDVRVAVAIALVLAGVALLLLLGLRLISDKNCGEEDRRELGASFQMHLGDIDLNIDLTGDAKPIALIGPNGSGKSTLHAPWLAPISLTKAAFKLEKGCYLIPIQIYLYRLKNDAWVMSLKAMHFSHT